jgi:hypothetical protein
MNEQYFENISTIEELIIAEQEGFSLDFKTNRPEMPGANLLHELARKCNVVLLYYLINNRNMDFNQLDEDECSPLGYVLNDDLLYEIKNGEITTVNEGCNDAIKIMQTIELLKTKGAACIYNGELYDENWIDQYIVELKKQL